MDLSWLAAFADNLPALGILAVAAVFWRYAPYMKDIRGNTTEIKNCLQQIQKEQGIMKVEIAHVREKQAEQDKIDKLYSQALQQQIRKNLMQIYKECKPKKSVPDEMWERWLRMYEVYRKLGGNSVMVDYNREMTAWRG